MFSPPRLVLVFPPVFEPDMPYLAVPALAGALRAAGLEVRIRDLNLEAHEAMLSATFLEHAVERIEQRLARLEASDELPADRFEEYRALVRAASLGPVLGQALPVALEMLQTEEAYDPASHRAAMAPIVAAFEVVSAAWWPTSLGYGSFDIPGWRWDAAGLLELSADEEKSPFPELLRRSGLLESLHADCDGATLLGISVVDSEQLVVALCVARAVRERLPSLRVVLGGPYLTKLVPELEAAPELFDVCDAVVAGEGETALRRLAELWAGDPCAPPHGIPNVLHRTASEKVVANRPFAVEDPRRLPPPDFTGLPLDRYWLPEPVLPVLATRGCYWNRCTFCAHSYIFRDRYAQREPDAVADELRLLSERHGARAFFFADESLSPAFVRRLSSALTERVPSAIWGMEARFEAGFDRETLRLARESGLRLVVFGLESANARVLERMRKGIDPAAARRILDDCIDLGIAAHLWLITGFPTEELHEAMESLRFVFEHPRLPGSPDFSVGLNRFALTRHCPIEQDPGAYDIHVPARRPDEAFQTVSRFERRSGMSEDELDEVFRRFDRLERSLPPDVRRTGRAYHVLRRAAVPDPPPRAPLEESQGPLAVRRSRFDLAEILHGLANPTPGGAAPPAKALPHPVVTMGVTLDGARAVLLRGRIREALDRAIPREVLKTVVNLS